MLAYHYLTTGYVDQAVDQWERVLALWPDDRLTAGLIRALQPYRERGEDLTGPPTSATPRRPPRSPGRASPGLGGTWIAHPGADRTITLVFRPEERIVWKVRQPGRDREFAGYAIYDRKTLTLARTRAMPSWAPSDGRTRASSPSRSSPGVPPTRA